MNRQTEAIAGADEAGRSQVLFLSVAFSPWRFLILNLSYVLPPFVSSFLVTLRETDFVDRGRVLLICIIWSSRSLSLSQIHSSLWWLASYFRCACITIVSLFICLANSRSSLCLLV